MIRVWKPTPARRGHQRHLFTDNAAEYRFGPGASQPVMIVLWKSEGHLRRHDW